MKHALSATLIHARGKGRVKQVTLALIKFGPLLLAATRKPLPGYWDEGQVLKELKAQPARFTVLPAGQEALPALLS